MVTATKSQGMKEIIRQVENLKRDKEERMVILIVDGTIINHGFTDIREIIFSLANAQAAMINEMKDMLAKH